MKIVNSEWKSSNPSKEDITANTTTDMNPKDENSEVFSMKYLNAKAKKRISFISNQVEVDKSIISGKEYCRSL